MAAVASEKERKERAEKLKQIMPRIRYGVQYAAVIRAAAPHPIMTARQKKEVKEGE